MKKKKEEEHYEIPPSSKNAKEINIQMATINPFFQESSHLPKNLQQHLSTSDNHNKKFCVVVLIYIRFIKSKYMIMKNWKSQETHTMLLLWMQIV